MSRASAKLVNSGMRLLRAFSSASSSSSSSSSSSTPSAAKALLLAAGVEHIAGSPDDVTVNGGGCLKDLDTSMPTNVRFLAHAKVPVPASVILHELSWDALQKSPVMQLEEYADVRREIEATMSQLQRCNDSNQNLSPEYSLAIVKRFWSWMGLGAVATALAVSPSGTAAVDAVIGDTAGALPMLRKYERAILRFLRSGDLDKAEVFANRAIQSCDRLKQLLDASYVQLSRTAKESRGRFHACLGLAGGAFVVGMGCDYLGFLPSVSDVAEATLELARELAVSGGLMILGVAAVNWLVSSDAREYLQRVSDAQLMRGRMKHRLEDMLSRVMLAREGEFLDSDEESGGEAPAGRTAALA